MRFTHSLKSARKEIPEILAAHRQKSSIGGYNILIVNDQSAVLVGVAAVQIQEIAELLFSELDYCRKQTFLF